MPRTEISAVLAFTLFVPLSVGVIGCSLTPRSAPPFRIGLAKSDLQNTELYFNGHKGKGV
jgi:hypothetical protein